MTDENKYLNKILTEMQEQLMKLNIAILELANKELEDKTPKSTIKIGGKLLIGGIDIPEKLAELEQKISKLENNFSECEIGTSSRDFTSITLTEQNPATTTVIHKEEDMYVAMCKETGTVSQGKTIKEALKNLKEATELYNSEMKKEELK